MRKPKKQKKKVLKTGKLQNSDYQLINPEHSGPVFAVLSKKNYHKDTKAQSWKNIKVLKFNYLGPILNILL